MTVARIIIVDGASSSGKTSMLRAFAELADQPFAVLSVDGFLPSLPAGVFAARAGSGAGWVAIYRDFFEYVAGHATSERLIVEVMLRWPEARDELFTQLGRQNLFYVQLYCSLAELERRERERGDRRHGLARSQYEAVYGFDASDLRVDSTTRSPAECARMVLRAYRGEPPGTLGSAHGSR